jgi:peptidoglycan/LPS O-acetylase OafA/YrhL
VNVRAERFPLIDSLRAISALAILGAHAALLAGIYTSGSRLRTYTVHLDTAVAVFFLISAFLLYRPFVLARVRGEPAPRTGAYAWRRFLRIVPGYWLALTLVGLWLGLSGIASPLWHLPLFYGFGQIYDSSTSLGGLGQAWTLCVEVTFYAFLPLWALAVRRLGMRGELAALAGLALVSVAWKAFALSHVQVSDYATGAFTAGPWLQPLPNFLDQFAVGMALAVVSVHGLPPRTTRLVARAWPWWLAAAGFYWLLANTAGKPSVDVSTATWLARHELHALIALALLVPAAFAWDRGGAVRRFLAWRPLLYVGLVSYGVYLWNNAVLIKLSSATSDWMTDTLGFGADARFLALFLGGVAGTVAIASVSYHLVERRLMSLGRLVPAGPRQPDPAEAIAEPAPAAPAAG